MHYYFDSKINLPVRTPSPTPGLLTLTEDRYREIVVGIAKEVQYRANGANVVEIIDNSNRFPRWYETKEVLQLPSGVLESTIVEKDPDLCMSYIKALRKQIEATGSYPIKDTKVPIDSSTIQGLREAIASGQELIDWKLGNGSFVDLTPVEATVILNDMLKWQQEQFTIERRYCDRFINGERWSPLTAEVWSLENANAETAPKRTTKAKRNK